MTFSLIEAVEKSGGVVGPYGERFGRLVILHLDHTRHYPNKKRRDFYDLCQCDCGNVKAIERDTFVYGDVVSCGCYHIGQIKKANTKHGLWNHPLYMVRLNMIRKCYEKNHRDYSKFGGKGIVVCDRWLESLPDFVADVESTIGPRPPGKVAFARINENGNFEPGNVRWTARSAISSKREKVRRISREKEIADRKEDEAQTPIAKEMNYIKGKYGCRYGRLFVLYGDSVRIHKNGSRSYFDMCQCECGVLKVIGRTDLRNGHVKSCGCFRKERAKQLRKNISQP